MKYFVSGGCSFSECITAPTHTWPAHLKEMLPDYKHISRGMGSAGNGLISRRVIYSVVELLKYHSPDDMLVGIMWSGPSRHDYYSTVIPAHFVGTTSINTGKKMFGMENPTNVANKNNWVILNHHWTTTLFPYAEQYYKYFYDPIGSRIYTYEHILRTQWFLKLHGIKYFMSTYTGEVFPEYEQENTDVSYLLAQIDREKFLPVIGEYEWCRDYSGLLFPANGGIHPSQAQHKLFVEQVVWPFLKIKNYVE